MDSTIYANSILVLQKLNMTLKKYQLMSLRFEIILLKIFIINHIQVIGYKNAKKIFGESPKKPQSMMVFPL